MTGARKLSSPRPSRWWSQIVLVTLFGGAAAFASVLLFNFVFFESMIQATAWVRAHVPGALAVEYPLVHTHFSDVVVAFSFGWLAGRQGQQLWLRFAVLFAVGYLFLPRLLVIAFYGLETPYSSGPSVGVTAILWAYDLGSVVPFAIVGAWLGSRPWKRRRESRLAAGRCLRCDYNLTGNESGVCPECGTPMGVRDKALAPSRDQPLQD